MTTVVNDGDLVKIDFERTNPAFRRFKRRFSHPIKSFKWASPLRNSPPTSGLNTNFVSFDEFGLSYDNDLIALVIQMLDHSNWAYVLIGGQKLWCKKIALEKIN